MGRIEWLTADGRARGPERVPIVPS